MWDVLEELDRQPGILRLSPETRARGDEPRRRTSSATWSSRTSDRPARCCTRSCGGTGWLARLAAGASVAAEEALSNIARFFDIIRAQSALLADDRAVFVARHLEHPDPGGRRPAHGRHRPRHRRRRRDDHPQGEGPRVPVRLPAGPGGPGASRRSASTSSSGLPLELVHETLPEGDYQLQEEQRLFYVGDDAGPRRADPDPRGRLRWPAGPPRLAVRARGAGPAGRRGGTGCRGHGRRRRWSASPRSSAPRPSRRHRGGAGDEPLVLSFYAIDDYMTCPLKYKYAHLLRVPLPPAPLADLPGHGACCGRGVPPAPRPRRRDDPRRHLFASFEQAWTNDGFLSREHEEARRAAGREALRRFRDEQLTPGHRGARLRRARVQLPARRGPRAGPGWTAWTSSPRDPNDAGGRS